jgi:hypothetical protein
MKVFDNTSRIIVYNDFIFMSEKKHAILRDLKQITIDIN